MELTVQFSTSGSLVLPFVRSKCVDIIRDKTEVEVARSELNRRECSAREAAVIRTKLLMSKSDRSSDRKVKVTVTQLMFYMRKVPVI